MATYNLRNGIPAQILTGDILNLPYRNSATDYGGTITLTLPKGTYRLEAWGSRGAWFGPSRSPRFCTGGYAAGTLTVTQAVTAYLTAGGVGAGNGGWGPNNPNNLVDGVPQTSQGVSSGSASDIRLKGNTLYHRVLVAGGGGGGRGSLSLLLNEPQGGAGGGTKGIDGAWNHYTFPDYLKENADAQNANYGYVGTGGTETSGGKNGFRFSWLTSLADITQAGFGVGAYYFNIDTPKKTVLASGGGGWYGGGFGGDYHGEYMTGGGGSGYAFSSATAGYAPSNYKLTSEHWLTDTVNITGWDYATPITEPDGTTAQGHQNEGYIRITVLVGQLPSPTVTSVTEPASGTLRIAFSTVQNAEGYRVTDGNGNVLATLSASPYTETGIMPGTEYVRKITALSSTYGNSAPATVTYLSESKLAAPTNLKAAYTAARTTLSWNAVSGATSYTVSRNGTAVASVTSPGYADNQAGAGTGFTYTVVAKASGRWDSDPASITTSNRPQLPNVTNLSASQTASSVTLSWTGAANATGYDVYRDGVKLGSTAETTYTDETAETGTTYQYTVYATAAGYYTSSGTTVTVAVKPQIETPTLLEAGQTQDSVTLNWRVRDYGASVTYTLRRDGELLYQGFGTSYTDTGLSPGQTCTYTLVAAIPGSGYYDSEPAVLPVLVGRDYTPQERQIDYLSSLRRPFTKLCRLRFLNPNGTTAFALDNNPKNRRSTAFIASGSVSANLQNGQRYSASVTLNNADLSFETAVNKIWFGQEVALDEGLVLSNGTEYYRQTGVFLIDNPQEKIDPKTRTVTYHLVDKWANLDGTLDGNLEGTYEVAVGTNIFQPMSALLSEDRGNGRPVDYVTPVYTEYYNGKTQSLPDGSVAVMTDSPYTLTVSGDGGTVAQVLLGLAGMLNAWIGYDHTGRLRIEPSQDDILDTQKPVLWRFSPEETQLLGLAYTVKKEDVYNDYIIVGEQLDDYQQPGARATNEDPRSDTCVGMIGRKTRRESASGYATVTQCADLAEWKLKRSSVLQKAVSVSCSQIMHIDLNSLVEIVRTDKPGNPIERHVIQGFTRPLAFSGVMTITAVSTADFPNATVTEWPERDN